MIVHRHARAPAAWIGMVLVLGVLNGWVSGPPSATAATPPPEPSDAGGGGGAGVALPATAAAVAPLAASDVGDAWSAPDGSSGTVVLGPRLPANGTVPGAAWV